MAKAGEANIIGVTSNDRVGAFPDAKTMKEQGIDTYFVNWRGFCRAGSAAGQARCLPKAIAKMYDPRMGRGPRTQWLGEHPQSGSDFMTFLEGQEKEIGDLMKKLGFL